MLGLLSKWSEQKKYIDVISRSASASILGRLLFHQGIFSAIFNIGSAHIVPKVQPKIRKIEPCTAPEKMQEMRQFLQHLYYIQVNHIYFAIITRESPKFVRFNFSRRISIGRTVLIPKHMDFFEFMVLCTSAHLIRDSSANELGSFVVGLEFSF